MNVATTGEFAAAFLIAEPQSGRGGDLPNAGQRHFGELAFPRIDQGDGVATGGGE